MTDGFPIGAIIAFPGNSDPPSSAHWAQCNGSSQSTTGSYAQLFAVIGYANGGSGASFNLPDYRGRFLRGTNYKATYNGVLNDPGTYSRTAMGPNGTGNTGNAIGSVQGYDTGAPNSPFAVDLPHLPNSNVSNAAGVHDTAAHWSGGIHTMPFQGGDAETRPKNLYVLYYIKYTDAVS
jgi:tail collar domain